MYALLPDSFLHPGVIRAHRLRYAREALNPDSARVDERTPAQLLAFIGRFSKQLHYIESDGKVDGDWSSLLSSDVSFLLAEILIFDIQKELDAVSLIVHRAAPAAYLERAVLQRIFLLYRQVSEWFTRAQQFEPPLVLTLQHLISGQLAPLYQLIVDPPGNPAAWQTNGCDGIDDDGIAGFASDWAAEWKKLADNPAQHDDSGLSYLWRNQKDSGDTLLNSPHGLLAADVQRVIRTGSQPGAAPVSTAPSGSSALGYLQTLHQFFVQRIGAMMPAIQAYFDDSLVSDTGHPPHTALLIAFVRLSDHARRDINNFTERHLEFYFRTVLGLKPQEGIADTAIVTFEPSAGSHGISVAIGQQLRAGKNATDEDLIYSVTRPLVVNQDVIVSLMTLHAGQYVMNGSTYIRRLYAAPVANSMNGLGQPLVSPLLGWPTFGRDWDRNLRVDDSAPLAQSGILLTSPMLVLRGGRRLLRIRLQFQKTMAQRSEAASGVSRNDAAPESLSSPAFLDVASAYHEAIAQSCGDMAGRSLDQAVLQSMTASCQVMVTTADGWLAAPRLRIRADMMQAWIELVILFPASFPSVARLAVPANIEEAGVDSPWPRLKIMLRPDAQVYPYSFAQQLVLDSIGLRAVVSGLVPALISVNGSKVDTGAPFFAFGPNPVCGNGLEASDPELSEKPVLKGALNLAWANLPQAPMDLATHYAGYGTAFASNDAFRASLRIRRGPRWDVAAPASRALFTVDATVDATVDPATAAPGDSADTVPEMRSMIVRMENTARDDFVRLADRITGHTLPQTGVSQKLPAQLPLLSSHRFGLRLSSGTATSADTGWDSVRMELNAPGEAFGNAIYPQVYTVAAATMAVALSHTASEHTPSSIPMTAVALAVETVAVLQQPAALPVLPRQPFCPLLKSVTIDYVAASRMTAQLPAPSGDAAPVSCFYQLGPFGYAATEIGGSTLLPRLDYPGQLCIGLKDLRPGQIVSLQFGLRQTSAMQRSWNRHADQPDNLHLRPHLDWYYLQQNSWVRIESRDIVLDTTDGLTCSGIVQLQTREHTLNTEHTVMPPGLFWIRAVTDKPALHAHIICLATQATTVTSTITKNGGSRPDSRRLPPGTINDFVIRPPGLRAVHQLMETGGGATAESVEVFRTRVSERLRHKQRIVSARDMEQLALTLFPALSQAKCIRAAAQPSAEPAGPGRTVCLVVVPERLQDASSGSRPAVSISLLQQIQARLLTLTSFGFRQLAVLNPTYEEIKVCVRLKFKNGVSWTPASHALGDALSVWLAPWQGDREIPLEIGGGQRSINDLAAWMAARPEIAQLASVTALHMFVCNGRRTSRWLRRDDRLAGSTAGSVLIPARQHAILNPEQHYGIGSMMISDDVMIMAESTASGAGKPAQSAVTTPSLPADGRLAASSVVHVHRLSIPSAQAFFSQQDTHHQGKPDL